MTRHKHLRLDQAKLDRAKELLGAKTEQETVERALDLVLGEEPIRKDHRRVKAVGGFEGDRRRFSGRSSSTRTSTSGG